MESSFKSYSIGLVIADKEPDSWQIDVFPIEINPVVDGELSSESTEEDISFQDADGNDVSIVVKHKNAITATWLPEGNDNRASAPDICKGETVMLYRRDGEDTVYWKSLFFEPALRKRETVMHFYSNKSALLAEGEDIGEYGYYTLVDTLNKQIKLHTSTTDEEPIGYDIIINTEDGKVSLIDTNGNYIQLDSQNDTLNLNLVKDMNLEIGENTNLTLGTNLTIELDKLSISNSTAELIELLIELIDTNMNEQHIGNLGAATALTPTYIQKYQDLKTKLESFKQ